MVKLNSGIDADIRVLPPSSFGAALQYFTGSKDHNILLRKLAIKKGWKLSEYGLFRGSKQIAGKTEEDVYEKLGLPWIAPELRAGKNEIEIAAQNKLPRLIELKDIAGDLQTHTTWSEGANSIEEIAEEARKIGYQYIAITDHTKSLAMTKGADEKKLLKQMEKIEKLNSKIPAQKQALGGAGKIQNSKILILKGAELNIMRDGSVDIKDEVLEKLDVAGAALHHQFNLSEEEETKRIIKAMENPHIDIIYHLTGRLIQKREPIKMNLAQIFKKAAETKTILEINAYPSRLDLKDEYVKEAKKYGVKFVIDTDAHATSELHFMDYGVMQARRGWLEKKDVLNTLPLNEFLEVMKKPKYKRW
jgi:DNA polymerase (family 10)